VGGVRTRTRTPAAFVPQVGFKCFKLNLVSTVGTPSQGRETAPSSTQSGFIAFSRRLWCPLKLRAAFRVALARSSRGLTLSPLPGDFSAPLEGGCASWHFFTCPQENECLLNVHTCRDDQLCIDLQTGWVLIKSGSFAKLLSCVNITWDVGLQFK
jgi:hypothetical protein